MNSFIKKYIAMDRTKTKLIENYEYIEWLYNFTHEYHSFCDTDWVYERDSLSDKDFENVNNLPLFFIAIEEYYDRNLIATCSQGFTRMLAIKYKNIFFEIAIITGQGTECYVKRSCECLLPRFVNFEDIVNNVADCKLTDKQQKLDELDKLLKQMQALKIPYSNIKQLFDSYKVD